MIDGAQGLERSKRFVNQGCPKRIFHNVAEDIWLCRARTEDAALSQSQRSIHSYMLTPQTYVSQVS